MKVAVVGAGGTGSAAARFLAAAGHQVTIFEQFEAGHKMGSSHGESRMIRYTYPDEFHTALMADAYRLWAELEEESAQELFVRCGGFLFGPNGHERVEETRKSLQALGLPFDEVDADTAKRRFPAIRLRPEESGIWQESSGFLRSTECILANLRLAVGGGAILMENTPVLGVEQAGGGVVVATPIAFQRFDRAVVTAGAWMGKVLAKLQLPLRVEQRQVVYMQIARDEGQFQPGRLPVWIDAGETFYGFPQDGRLTGVKIASHVLGAAFDPDRADRPVVDSSVQEVVKFAQMRFPDLSGDVASATACLYTLTPDENFIVDFVPEMPDVFLVSGCSGHGFKFTVLLGHIAAALAAGQSYGRDLSPWKLARFNNFN